MPNKSSLNPPPTPVTGAHVSRCFFQYMSPILVTTCTCTSWHTRLSCTQFAAALCLLATEPSGTYLSLRNLTARTLVGNSSSNTFSFLRSSQTTTGRQATYINQYETINDCHSTICGRVLRAWPPTD